MKEKIRVPKKKKLLKHIIKSNNFYNKIKTKKNHMPKKLYF